MSRKRPSVIDTLDLRGEEAPPPPAAAPASNVVAMQSMEPAPALTAPAPKPAAKPKARPDVKHKYLRPEGGLPKNPGDCQHRGSQAARCHHGRRRSGARQIWLSESGRIQERQEEVEL
jgi:hypothetical protein